MKSKFKKRIVAFLCVIVLLFNVFPVGALSVVQFDFLISEDVAVTVAAHFVWGSLEVSDVWNEQTTIGNVVPLYNVDDEINAYCVNLITDGVQTGYVVVSANINESLIQEYSYTANTLNIEDSYASSNSRTVSNKSERIYYYGPLSYSTAKYYTEDDNAKSVSNDIENAENNHAEENKAYISYLKKYGLIPTNNGTRNSSNDEIPISSINEYLKDKYPDKTFTIDTTNANMVLEKVEGYVIKGYNACSLYGSAAMIRFHLGYDYDFSIDAIADQLKVFAAENGFAEWEKDKNRWNYYIHIGSLAPFINACINEFTILDKKASSSLFSWSTGTDEITAGRPILLNIDKSEQYEDHTVLAFAWCEYVNRSGGKPSKIRFYGVKDGYVTDTRFVNYEEIGLSYITKVK